MYTYIYMYLYHDTVYANAKFFELVHGPVDGLLQFRWFGGWIVHCWSYKSAIQGIIGEWLLGECPQDHWICINVSLCSPVAQRSNRMNRIRPPEVFVNLVGWKLASFRQGFPEKLIIIYTGPFPICSSGNPAT